MARYFFLKNPKKKVFYLLKKRIENIVVEKTALISVDLSLPHRFNIDDLFADFNNTFPVFRNGNFKIGKLFHIHQLRGVTYYGDYLAALALNHRNICLCRYRLNDRSFYPIKDTDCIDPCLRGTMFSGF